MRSWSYKTEVEELLAEKNCANSLTAGKNSDLFEEPISAVKTQWRWGKKPKPRLKVEQGLVSQHKSVGFIWRSMVNKQSGEVTQSNSPFMIPFGTVMKDRKSK